MAKTITWTEREQRIIQKARSALASKGGAARWKGKTKAERSDYMRNLAKQRHAKQADDDAAEE